jgi:hypothetical protein
VVPSNPQSPDQVSPPRADEPLAKTGGAGTGTAIAVEPGLDAEKTAALNTVVADKTPAPPVPPVVVPPPVIENPQPTPAPQLPPRGIIWGRWQPVNEYYAQFSLAQTLKQNELLAVNGNFALFRTPATAGQDYVLPSNGTIGFSLWDSNAFVYTDYSYKSRIATPATLTNGSLTVNFGNRSFATSLDLIYGGSTTKLQAQGAIGIDGRLYGDAANGKPGLINVQGLLSNDKGGSAAYIFDGRLDALRTVNGGTYWRK